MKWDMICQECGDKILCLETEDDKQIVKLTAVCDGCMTTNDYGKPKRKVDELVKFDPKQKRLAA